MTDLPDNPSSLGAQKGPLVWFRGLRQRDAHIVALLQQVAAVTAQRDLLEARVGALQEELRLLHASSLSDLRRSCDWLAMQHGKPPLFDKEMSQPARSSAAPVAVPHMDRLRAEKARRDKFYSENIVVGEKPLPTQLHGDDAGTDRKPGPNGSDVGGRAGTSEVS